jgi:hypothetical protein
MATGNSRRRELRSAKSDRIEETTWRALRLYRQTRRNNSIQAIMKPIGRDTTALFADSRSTIRPSASGARIHE